MRQVQENNTPNSTCRTCLQTSSDLFYNIYQTMDLQNKLSACTSLTIKSGDRFPTSICQSCFLKVNDFYDFQQMCIKAEREYALIAAKMSSIKDELLETTQQVKQEREETVEDSQCFELQSSKSELVMPCDQVESKRKVNGTSAQSDTSGGCNENSSKNCKTILKCELCNKNFLKERLLEAHKRIHEGLKPFPCAQCGKSFCKLYRLKLHKKSKHDRKKEEDLERFTCPEEGCEKTYAAAQSLQTHVRDAHKGTGNIRNPRQYICEDCGKALSSLTKLNNHRYIHTGQQLPFECPECNKRYITKHKLKVHLNRHAGIKNYVCPHCGARRTTRTELNTHINQTHTKERTYSCKFCEQVFNSIGNLGRHVRIVHEGIKQFKCSHCDKSFGKAETRKYHEMTHTGEKPHECKVCQKKFIQPTSLQKHMQTHSKAADVVSGGS